MPCCCGGALESTVGTVHMGELTGFTEKVWAGQVDPTSTTNGHE